MICAWEKCKRIASPQNRVKVGNHELTYCWQHFPFVKENLRNGSQTNGGNQYKKINDWHKRRFAK